MLSSFVSLESGRPFNVFAGLDANADGNPLSDRPGLLGRNTLIGPGYASVDLRIARDVQFNERWKSQFSVDFFNLFNRVNIKDLNTVLGSADLSAPPISSFKPQEMCLILVRSSLAPGLCFRRSEGASSHERQAY
jgi:hypothetical protein